MNLGRKECSLGPLLTVYEACQSFPELLMNELCDILEVYQDRCSTFCMISRQMEALDEIQMFFSHLMSTTSMSGVFLNTDFGMPIVNVSFNPALPHLCKK